MRCPVLLLPLLRKWRSHGHGIHSPFAFSFATNVLRQPHSYYAYSETDPLATGKTDRLRAQRLYRIVLALRPSALEFHATISPACQKAATLAMQGFSHSTSGPLHIYNVSNTIPSSAFPPALLPDHSAVVIGSGQQLRHTAEALFTQLSNGMLFAGSHMAVIIALSHLPRQKFPIDI